MPRFQLCGSTISQSPNDTRETILRRGLGALASLSRVTIPPVTGDHRGLRRPRRERRQPWKAIISGRVRQTCYLGVNGFGYFVEAYLEYSTTVYLDGTQKYFKQSAELFESSCGMRYHIYHVVLFYVRIVSMCFFMKPLGSTNQRKSTAESLQKKSLPG